MAKKETARWQQEYVVVRQGKKVFSLSASELERFRSPRLEALSAAELDQFFASHARLDAASANSVVIMNGDFAPQ
jgi:hypothetical protein